jgi:hypothetical protein
VKYIPSNTIRIPLRVFSLRRDGLIRLPTSEEEASRIVETFDINSDEEPDEGRFRDEDDDIPPTVASRQKVKVQEDEEDFFDVSDDEDEVDHRRPVG